MLLANTAVADKIKKHFPYKALLRRHPVPQSKMVDELVSQTIEIKMRLFTFGLSVNKKGTN